MILTSYFANYRKFPIGRKKVSISRFPPKWFEADIQASELAPSSTLLMDYKNGKVTDEEYEVIYRRETLSKLDPAVIYAKYKDAVFLCYESDSDFCHRQIVTDWLREHGYFSMELPDIPVNIAIVGSRNFEDYIVFSNIIDKLIERYGKVRFVSGGAYGADKLAERYAKEHDIEIKIFPYEKKLGKAGGYSRNVKIWEYADLGIAFWDGESKGTTHSFSISKAQKKEIFVFNYVISKWHDPYNT